ncbi:DUF4868 domain-containing protein [Lachnospiraceae bacterium OttesenSCG-928-D06]|nr:DUF4868 domain-containing protein [Lachnospiraceae bacterium OttesenSCG-928-D06]
MSTEFVKMAFASLNTNPAWTLQLLRIKNSRREGTSYAGREISLFPEGRLNTFVSEIVDHYTDENRGALKSYTGIWEYDGTTLDKTIYKIKTDNPLIATEYSDLKEALANPDVESDPLEFGAQAYVLKGTVTIDETDRAVKLISLQKPVTNLKHKFMKSSGTFKEIDDKVLSLRTSIDVIIVDDMVYMLNLAAENLFNMERAYRATCTAKLDIVKECEIVSDYDTFVTIAGSGHNPRKFVSFNENHLQKLKNTNSRRKIAKKFNLPLKDDKFDTELKEVSDKLVKILCNRGMVDPFDDEPMEVAGSKKWE